MRVFTVPRKVKRSFESKNWKHGTLAQNKRQAGRDTAQFGY